MTPDDMPSEPCPEPFKPDDPTDAMAENFRRQVTNLAVDAYKITIYREMNTQQQFECFVAGALTGFVGVCLASIKTDGADTMMEYIASCLPYARTMAESVTDKNGRPVINLHDQSVARAPAPHVPAAFITALSESGTREELIERLQKLWNENCALRAQAAVAAPSDAMREAIAKALATKWPGDFAYGDPPEGPNDFAFENADVVLAALSLEIHAGFIAPKSKGVSYVAPNRKSSS